MSLEKEIYYSAKWNVTLWQVFLSINIFILSNSQELKEKKIVYYDIHKKCDKRFIYVNIIC